MRSLSRKRAMRCGIAASMMSVIATTAFAASADEPKTANPDTKPPEEKAPEEKAAKNSIYAEGLGPGLAYSINYDRLITDVLAARIGFSYLSFSASASSGTSTSTSSAAFMTFPITVSYLGIGGRKHMLELGGGATIAYASGSASGVGASASGSGAVPFGDLIVGYRLQPPDGGFNFRVGMSVIMGKGLGYSNVDPSKFGAIPWPYLSLGGTF